MRLVKSFTLILLTVSTSSTFETALFPPYKYRTWGGCLIYRYLESKVMLVDCIQKSLEQWNSESFGYRGVLVSGVGL